ncbi:TetR/AcrR family transcriptional regulator [Zhongshania sp.]|uniref:TetR/AcrR family transcriptional regulator n=1 Tax=Zhongshania sp. TaxID=1971902 RepID=UPI0035653CA0
MDNRNTKPASAVTETRGRKPSATADKAILDAARAVLQETGYPGFTMSAVVKRSGVSSATIYRRWRSSQELILDAFRSMTPILETPDSGCFDNDLSTFLDDFAAALSGVGSFVALDKMDSRIEPQLRREIAEIFTEPRKKILAAIFDRAVLSGALKKRPDIDDCWNFIAGPLHHRISIQQKKYTTTFAKQTKAFITAGLFALAKQ